MGNVIHHDVIYRARGHTFYIYIEEQSTSLASSLFMELMTNNNLEGYIVSLPKVQLQKSCIQDRGKRLKNSSMSA